MFEGHDLVSRSRIKALKIASCAILASLLVLCAQVVLLQAGSVRAQGTLDVCSGCTYESIQEAIDAADPGDTIRVAQGVYTENLMITKSLTLLGGFESAGWTRDIELYETTIDGNRSGSVISVTNGCSTTIDGFTITNGATDHGGGIYVDGSAVTVTNNQIRENMTWFTREAITITEPLRAGDTDVKGVSDPDLVDLVYVWDVTTDSRVGSDHAEPDGTFTVTFWSPLVESHVIAAFGAYGYDEAIVQPALGTGAEANAPTRATGAGVAGRAVGDGAGASASASAPSPERLAGGPEEGEEFSLRGGGIYLVDSTALISGNQIVSNTARDFGGGIYADASVVSIAANDVVGNSSGRVFPVSWYEGYGGGIAILPGSEFTVTGNLIADNRVVLGGGGIYITDSVGSLVDNEIRENGTGDAWEERAFGGGVYVGNCSPRIQGNEIITNMLGTTESALDYCGLGGGVYLVDSSSLVTDNTITGNRVVLGPTFEEDAQGGGIFAGEARGGSPLSCASSWLPGTGSVRPVIAHNRIEGNSVEGALWPYEGQGGGVSAWGVSVTLLDNEIVDNCAGSDGGGVLITQYAAMGDAPWVTATISGNLFTGNYLRSEPYSWGGGGLSVGGSVRAIVSDNVISYNDGRAAGGLLLDSARGVVDGNRILGNEGYIAGGVLALSSDDLTFSGNEIIGNASPQNLGGIGVGSGNFVLRQNAIISNTGAHGAGIAVGIQTTTVTLDANRLLANRASQRGGGILIYPDTVFTLTNNIIADNSAEELGDGIHISDSQGSLVNNTIAKNDEGAGEGVYLAGTADATILNNIIVSHTYGIYNAGSGTPDVTYNDVWGNSVGDYYGVTPGTGNISSDPLFVDPEGWDYHVRLQSPAVNMAHPDDSLAPALDIDGDARPSGIGVDMGADEVFWYRFLFALAMRDRLQ